MLEAATKAVAYTRGHERAVLDIEEMRALAVVRLLEIVGQAGQGGDGLHPSAVFQRCPGNRSQGLAIG